jgi:cAMP phosphodiesterase
VKITLAPPAINSAPHAPPHFLTTYLVNDSVAVDAGCLGFLGDLDQQQRVRHVLISHTHIDHVASLPIFLENVVGESPPVTIHATAPVLECLQKDMFNDRIWPNFIALTRDGEPFVKLAAIQPGKTFTIDGLRITPVEVNHIVPTCGFIVEDDAAAAVIASDTGPTDEIWKRANTLPTLKAVFLEATFPDSMSGLAEVAKHLTPATFAAETRKLKTGVRLIAVHLKARVYGQIVTELNALRLADLEIAKYGEPYQF